MSDLSIPLSALARFHREVIIRDVERIVGASEQRIRDEMHAIQDASATKMDRLEFEYQAIKAGLVRVEVRLQAIEQGLGRLEERLEHVEEPLVRVERHLDGLQAEHRALASAVHHVDERLSQVE